MKKQLMSVVRTKQGKMIPVILSFMLLSNASFAQEVNHSDSVQAAVVKHIGTYEDKQYFQVQYNNDSSDKFLFTIKDQYGSILFQEKYQTQKFDKKFQLNKPEDSEKLTFIIRNLKDNKTQVFEIVNTTHVT